MGKLSKDEQKIFDKVESVEFFANTMMNLCNMRKQVNLDAKNPKDTMQDMPVPYSVIEDIYYCCIFIQLIILDECDEIGEMLDHLEQGFHHAKCDFKKYREQAKQKEQSDDGKVVNFAEYVFKKKG